MCGPGSYPSSAIPPRKTAIEPEPEAAAAVLAGPRRGNEHVLVVEDERGVAGFVRIQSTDDPETGELIGCEHFMAQRAVTPELGRAIIDSVAKAARYYQTLGHSSFAQEPAWFTTAPIHALHALHDKLGWSPDDVDLYEINEAFAVVTMAAMTDLGLDPAVVNINGGACALGHPIGASGARIVVTLIHALQKQGLHRGVAGLCIGGGEATAIAIELV